MAFVERSTDGRTQVVVLRYAAAFYWVVWPAMVATIFATVSSSTLATVAMIGMWVVLLAIAIPYWPVTLELKRRMRTSAITASGSKYSFSNPLTYRWEILA
jgi:hypothetical protein